MLHHLHSALIILAAPDDDGAGSGPSLNADGIVQWSVGNILPLLLLVAGIGIIASGRKGNISQNANHLSNILLGCGVIAGAAVLYTFSEQVVGLAFK